MWNNISDTTNSTPFLVGSAGAMLLSILCALLFLACIVTLFIFLCSKRRRYESWNELP